MDYAGLIAIRTALGQGRKSRKAYIALFICLMTKALHLELVSDYISSIFIAAYQHFVSRRELPQSMYSETTVLIENFPMRKQFEIRISVTNEAWHFLSPALPHFGGLWDVDVKSVKHCLERCIHTLTFVEMSMLVCRIEACLNSLPIVPVLY